MLYICSDAIEEASLGSLAINRESGVCRGLCHDDRNPLFDPSTRALDQQARGSPPCRAGRKAEPL